MKKILIFVSLVLALLLISSFVAFALSPPWMIRFENVSEIKGFVLAANGSQDKYFSFKEEYPSLCSGVVDHNHAKDIAEKLSSQQFPIFDGEFDSLNYTINGFVAIDTTQVLGEYFDSFSLVLKKSTNSEGFYAFDYSFQENTNYSISPENYDIVKKIGKYSVGLNEEEDFKGFFIGTFLDEDLNFIRIRIRTDGSEPNFDGFEMGSYNKFIRHYNGDTSAETLTNALWIISVVLIGVAVIVLIALKSRKKKHLCQADVEAIDQSTPDDTPHSAEE